MITKEDSASGMWFMNKRAVAGDPDIVDLPVLKGHHGEAAIDQHMERSEKSGQIDRMAD